MGRDGFRNADVDVHLLRDIKVRRLRAAAPDEGEGAIRTLVYVGLLLSSWADGERLDVVESDSPYEATPERMSALREAGLVDDDSRVPAKAWSSWYAPARDRRAAKREGGREGADRRWHPSGSPNGSPNGSAYGSPNGSPTRTANGPANARPSPSQSVPPSSRARKREDPDTTRPTPIADLLRDLPIIPKETR